MKGGTIFIKIDPELNKKYTMMCKHQRTDKTEDLTKHIKKAIKKWEEQLKTKQENE